MLHRPISPGSPIPSGQPRSTPLAFLIALFGSAVLTFYVGGAQSSAASRPDTAVSIPVERPKSKVQRGSSLDFGHSTLDWQEDELWWLPPGTKGRAAFMHTQPPQEDVPPAVSPTSTPCATSYTISGALSVNDLSQVG